METYNGETVVMSRTLEASGARSTDGTTTAVYVPAGERGLIAVLDVTSTNTGDVLDKLDIYIQTSIGSIWHDIIHFEQVDGTVGAGAERYVHKMIYDATNAEYEEATGLAEKADRNYAGDSFRVRRDVTDGGGTHSFTYSVVVIPV